MFTGLIEDCGKIINLMKSGSATKLSIQTGLPTAELLIGDSVAVNGACLTVVAKDAHSFTVDMSPETFERTTFAHLSNGNRVNLERALRMGDRLGGHIVTGHIDSIGVITSVNREQNAIILAVQIPDEMSRYLVEKGSVSIDGVSLTINSVNAGQFSVSIIPHTLKATTLIDCSPGVKVNIETDILGKYVERLLGYSDKQNESSKMTGEFLAKHGFM